VTITGQPAEERTLTAANNLGDEDGLGPITYQWRANSTNISGATAINYTLTQAEVGKTITVVANYTDGQGTLESVTSAAVGPVLNVNDPPTGTVTITGILTEGQTLTAGNNIADEDGLGPITYQWRSGLVDIAGATAGTYTLTQAEVGSTITVVASYTDGTGFPESVTSAAVGPVTNVNDPPTGGVTIDGTPAEDQQLTANTSVLADEDGLGAFSYQWKANGGNIGGATAVDYTLTQTEVGSTITVAVSYTDGQGTPETVTSAGVGPVANVNDLPTGVVTINGTPAEDEQLTANTSALADEDGLGAFSYQWRAGGVNISGATAINYTLTPAEIGSTITVVVSYTDLQSTAESVISAPTAAVLNANDPPVGQRDS
jgi:hypothetical protein